MMATNLNDLLQILNGDNQKENSENTTQLLLKLLLSRAINQAPTQPETPEPPRTIDLTNFTRID